MNLLQSKKFRHDLLKVTKQYKNMFLTVISLYLLKKKL